MAIAFVQKSPQLFADNASSISPSLAGTTAGNLVVLIVNTEDAGTANPAAAIATPAGWTAAIAPTGAPGTDAFKPSVGIFYKENIAGGVESATVTLPVNSYAMATIVEFSGVATSSSLDVVASSVLNASISGTSGTTAATALADSVAIVVGCPQNNTGTVTDLSSPAETAYTSIYASQFVGAGHAVGDQSYKILSATGTQSGFWSWTESANFAGAIAVFSGTAPAAGTGGPFVPVFRRRRR